MRFEFVVRRGSADLLQETNVDSVAIGTDIAVGVEVAIGTKRPARRFVQSAARADVAGVNALFPVERDRDAGNG